MLQLVEGGRAHVTIATSNKGGCASVGLSVTVPRSIRLLLAVLAQQGHDELVALVALTMVFPEDTVGWRYDRSDTVVLCTSNANVLCSSNPSLRPSLH